MSDETRLAALLHEADCKPNHLYCDGQRCEDIAARLIAQGVRVGDDLDAALVRMDEAQERVDAALARLRAGVESRAAAQAVALAAQKMTPEMAARRALAIEALAAQPAPPALTAASPEAAGLDRERLQAILDAADAMAEAWAKGGWRISTDYHTIEVAYERYLMARTI